jgi:hypothetical protein
VQRSTHEDRRHQFFGQRGQEHRGQHLLLPRIPGAELIAVESLNAHEGQAQALRGRQFGELQEYLQTVDSAVVDIGASNVEELLTLMQSYRGSHEEFDCFVVPTVPPLKQQQDTIATLVELSRLGVPPSRLKLVFNMTEAGFPVEHSFFMLLAFVAEQPLAVADLACCLSSNEIYARIRGTGVDLGTLARDDTDYKALIAKAQNTAEKITLARKLATRRLALGVVPELDACFRALGLGPGNEAIAPAPRQAA